MNNDAAPLHNSPAKQNPAQSSREFMKHPGQMYFGEKVYTMKPLMPPIEKRAGSGSMAQGLLHAEN
ncbi:MAG: hypothetical protein L0H15_06205 [Nitrosospira sp.]|nr:hypothetical protein [Nitrosospira sp.]